MALLILIQIPLGTAYLEAGTADTSSLRALSTVFNQANLYAYEFAMITVGVAGLILCYGVLPDRACSPAAGRLGPGRVPGPSHRLGLAGPRIRPEFDPCHPGRPVGGLHRRLADRQGIQQLAEHLRADDIAHDPCAGPVAGGQRDQLIRFPTDS